MYRYVVTYDLRTPGKDYSSLISKIKTYSYSKICESVWIVKSNHSSSEVRDSLLNEIDYNDRLFVAKLTGEAAWHNCIDSTDNIKKILS
jgi:hypothetical protein